MELGNAKQIFRKPGGNRMDKKPQSTVIKVVAAILVVVVAMTVVNIIWSIIKGSLMLLIEAIILVAVGAAVVWVINWIKGDRQ